MAHFFKKKIGNIYGIQIPKLKWRTWNNKHASKSLSKPVSHLSKQKLGIKTIVRCFELSSGLKNRWRIIGIVA